MPTWMFRSKESEAARQATLREQRQSKGNCIRCGFMLDRTSKQLCTIHLVQERRYQLTRYHAGKRKATP